MSEAFAELKPPLGHDQAVAEANRCLMCYDAPCTRACPTHIDVPGFIKKISTGNLRGSARTILEANILGASCARVCPTEVLCEGACVMHDLHHRPIDIGRLQRYATDWVLDRNERLFTPGLRRGRRVGIVGAGPAGLSCAAELARLGYDVTIYEASDVPGGLNTVGVAEYKMRAETSLREIEWVRQLGAEVKLKTPVGPGGIALSDLESRYEAIFLGVGLGAVRAVGVENEDHARDALEFIAELKLEREKARGKIGRRVAVIGGGNTAIDAVTQSARLGAEEVTLVYRRGAAEMTAYAHEVELAKHDSVRFLFHAAPKRVVLEGGPQPASLAGGVASEASPHRSTDRVVGLEVVRVEARGRDLVPVAGSETVLPVDTVIKATGQTAREALLKSVPNLVFEGGRPVHDPVTHQTSNPRYFIGGDAGNGGKEVVNAVAEGKRAARGIHRHLSGETGTEKGN